MIPPGSKVIYVVGADGIGKPIAESAHRPELYARRLGTDVGHVVTPKDAAAMVDYGDTVLSTRRRGQRTWKTAGPSRRRSMEER